MVETPNAHRHQHLAVFGVVSRILFKLLYVTSDGIELIFSRLDNAEVLLASPSNLVSQLGRKCA